MRFFDELARHSDSPYGVVALICSLVILLIFKYAPAYLKVKLSVSILVIGIIAVVIINSYARPPNQVLNQHNNGSGGVFNVNSGSGVQINNEGK
ncbi:hypothetical protein [Pantoea sp. SJZ147]|uniref:hypothetical protein n=1 Tax=Pantoea sp. SJZ147 TaxID=2572896 RepID=UPI0011A0005A|nr:hypothetical protein [Pantoea sp. SJZ147]TWD44043.1 hypothetical protein FBY13_102182 [Pantoea sp. SJZ147]